MVVPQECICRVILVQLVLSRAVANRETLRLDTGFPLRIMRDTPNLTNPTADHHGVAQEAPDPWHAWVIRKGVLTILYPNQR